MEAEELIQLVYMHEELYNPMHKHYHDKNHKDKVWQFIAENLGAKASDCRMRWVTLRDQYRKAMRKKLLKKGAYQGKWKLEDEMSFLMPYVKRKDGNSLIDSVIVWDDDNNSLINSDDAKKEITPAIFMPRKSNLTKPLMEKLTTPVTESAQNVSVLKESKKTDPIDLFCSTIGNTMRQFSPYYQNMAKMKIFKIVSDIELKQISNDPSESSKTDHEADAIMDDSDDDE